MISATGLSKRLKITSFTKEPGKFYLESDREDFEKFKFNKLGELKIIEITGVGEVYKNFEKIYYYSETQDKKIITSNMGAEYGGKLFLETFRKNLFLEDVEMINIPYPHNKRKYFKTRKKEALNTHLKRIEKINLKEISLGDGMKGMEYIIRGVKNSY
ncbi:hypothetical protein HYT91_01110 [Candidatus Pacearchaeota archaeon]|nr:hypothetical protein [Candidatus Pacearchaeota archaeon]